jgi:hypothetical protein
MSDDNPNLYPANPQPPTPEPGEHPGITALREVLWSMRWHDQGGYCSYLGDGKWGFVTSGLPQTTPEQLNAMMALVGIIPDRIESVGSCAECAHFLEHRGGRWGPCGSCKKPRNGNFEPVHIPVPKYERQLCPHDGGRCHHKCESECTRKQAGWSLTTPWEGFPVDGDAPVEDTDEDR